MLFYQSKVLLSIYWEFGPNFDYYKIEYPHVSYTFFGCRMMAAAMVNWDGLASFT
jgi:hypothetical protein